MLRPRPLRSSARLPAAWLVGALALLGALLPVLACRPPAQVMTQEPCPKDSSKIGAGEGDASEAAAIDADWVAAHYTKREVMIPMRDGIRLHTAIYSPKDGEPAPILLKRTPYSSAPYGADAFPMNLGPSALLAADGYIFVYQDVRGRFMSEGEFINVRPHNPAKSGPQEIDESTDTYDTIAWLLTNLSAKRPENGPANGVRHNGRVGIWGISYPGFYAAMGMIDHHPALVAVSPQAPIADWYFDDFFHHGAFFLPHFFNFFVNFGRPQERPATAWGPRFDHGTADGYAFFLALGALRNLERYFKGEVAFWRDVVAHPTYDDFWAARSLLPHLKGVAPAVMVVGGLFDAEDLYGPLSVYRAVVEQNPGVASHLVMGPWSHGAWAREAGDHLGNISFGGATSAYYQGEIERVFFDHHLRGPGSAAASGLAAATIFNTGANRWRRFDTWPPEQVEERALYLAEDGVLAVDLAPTAARGADRFVSDPARPVPATEDVAIGMTREYMTDDQRFAARRSDVLVYETPPLTAELTVAGPLAAELWVATTAGDADWVVKLIDVFPSDADDSEHPEMRPGKRASGYQMMVRSEVFRGRYRGGYDRPQRFSPGQATALRIPLQDVLHTFKAGHRIMIQVQSTWFPLVDRNPQRWVDNIFEASDDDFQAATHTVFRERRHPSRLVVGVLPEETTKD